MAIGAEGWHYDPAMPFYWRFVMTTLHDALQVVDGKPTDEAIFARDWFATSEMRAHGEPREAISFPECCHWLGVDVDADRVGFLEIIDRSADFDTEEAWTRLEFLSAQVPDDTEVLFVPEGFARIVPELDQCALGLEMVNLTKEPKVKRVKTAVTAVVMKPRRSKGVCCCSASASPHQSSIRIGMSFDLVRCKACPLIRRVSRRKSRSN